jgi:hypothetical protein
VFTPIQTGYIRFEPDNISVLDTDITYGHLGLPRLYLHPSRLLGIRRPTSGPEVLENGVTRCHSACMHHNHHDWP